MSKHYVDGDGRSINQFGTPVGPPVGQPVGEPVANPAGPPAAPAPYGQPPLAAAPSYPPAYPPVPASYGPYAPARQGMSTGAKVAIALGGAVAGLVVLGILAAIAIPVFLNQRAKSEAEGITITLPAQIAAYPRMTGAQDEQVQSLVAGLPPEAGTAQGAAYGVGRAMVIVIAGRHVMLPKDRTDYLDGVTRSEARNGVTQVSVDPGPLGGQMRCGAASDGTRTDCAFADAGAYGVIDVATTGPEAVALVLQVRAAVETHR